MVTGIYRRKGVITEKANGTTFTSPPSPQSFIQELTNWTCKSTKTSHVNPANRKIHSQALVAVMWMWVLWVCVLKKQKGDFGTAFFFFFQSIVAWSLQSSCLIKRNTIFNTTIQKKPFSSTLLKKKPGKLKREKEKSPSLGEGKGREAGGTKSRRITNGQTSIHQEASKTTSGKKGVRYVQFVRRLGKAWGGKGRGGRQRRGLVQYFCVFF